MDILIVCHDYKNHKELTFFQKGIEPIVLNASSIKNIKKASNGLIKSINYIDTAAREKDKVQYNDWTQVSSRKKYDYVFLIHCPLVLDHEIQPHLKPDGKTITIEFGKKMTKREERELLSKLFGPSAAPPVEDDPEDDVINGIHIREYAESGEPYVYSEDISGFEAYITVKGKEKVKKTRTKTVTKKQSAGRRRNATRRHRRHQNT